MNDSEYSEFDADIWASDLRMAIERLSLSGHDPVSSIEYEDLVLAFFEVLAIGFSAPSLVQMLALLNTEANLGCFRNKLLVFAKELVSRASS